MATSWATKEDLYLRFGTEFMDKVSTRNIYNSELESYVADESQAGRDAVINAALEDAKALLSYKMGCVFDSVTQLNMILFPIIKSWHVRLTIEALKKGGDCMSCTECNGEFDEFLKCGSICSGSGECLSLKGTFISATEAKFPCEDDRGCKC